MAPSREMEVRSGATLGQDDDKTTEPATPAVVAEHGRVTRTTSLKGPRVITEADLAKQPSWNGQTPLSAKRSDDGRHIVFDMPQKSAAPFGDEEDDDTSSSEEEAPVPAPRPVHERPDFKYLIFLGSVLTMCAGFVNGVALTEGGRTVTHVSGNTAKTGHYLALGKYTQSGNYALICFSFLTGAIISGMGVGSTKFVMGHRYGWFMLCIGCLLLLGALLTETDTDNMVTFALWACATGMQNGMYTSFSGAVIRTTHTTGTLTDIGTCIGHWLRYRFVFGNQKEVPTWKLRVLVPLYLSFFSGVCLATWAADEIGFRAAYFPAGLYIGLGVIYIALASNGAFDGFLAEDRVEEEIKQMEEKFSAALQNALHQHQQQHQGEAPNVATQLSAISKTASQISRQLSTQLTHNLDRNGLVHRHPRPLTGERSPSHRGE